MNLSPTPRAALNVQVGKTSIEELRNFQQQAAAKGGGEIRARANDDGSHTLYVSGTENDGARATAARSSSAGERADKQHLAQRLIRDIIGRRLPPGSPAARVLLAHIDTRRSTADLADALAVQQALARQAAAHGADGGEAPATGKPPSPLANPEATVAYFAARGQGWEEIKLEYIKPTDASGAAMKVLQAHRQQVVDSLLHTVIARLGERHVHFTSAGSDNLTSDYDVQLYDDGSLEGNPGRVIAEFNTDFRQRYGLESGTLFDTNLYDPSCRLPRELATEDRYIAESERRTDAANDNSQIVGSLAKVRKFADVEVWAKLHFGIKAACRTDDQRARVEAHFAGAAKLITTMRNQIAGELAHAGDKPNENDRLRATNILYTRALQDVQSARKAQELILRDLHAEVTPEARNASHDLLDAATLWRKQAMVNATLFAHEAYHSEGPMIGVVGIGQGVIARSFEYQRPDPSNNGTKSWGESQPRTNPVLRRAHILESFNENFGDALKDINHYKKGEKAFERTMVQVSKYLGRCFESADAAGVALDDGLRAIRGSLDDLKRLRAGADFELGDLQGRFAAAGISTVRNLVAALTDLAIRTNAAVLAPAPAQQSPDHLADGAASSAPRP